MLLFSDTQIRHDTFVEDLANLVTAGVVPNLFDAAERGACGEAVRAGLSRLRALKARFE